MLRRALRVMVAVLCGLGFLRTDLAWSHHRTRGPGRPTPEKSAGAQASVVPSHHLSGEQASATGGKNAPSSLDNLLKTANVFSGPRRLAAFLQLARQAETHGHPDLAVKVYTLAASLHPESPETNRARLRRLIVEFYLALGDALDPCPPFQNFLHELSRLGAKFSPEDLRESLVAGWAAMERRVMANFPGPISLAEEALTLWELHPAGTRPPEAALLVGRLLKNQGLFEEAKELLVFARQKGTYQVRTQALAELLQLAWVSRGLPGFLEAFCYWQQREPGELIFALRSWPLNLCSQPAGAPTPTSAVRADLEGLAAGDASTPHLPGFFANLAGPPWKVLMGQPLPVALQEYVVRDAARQSWLKGDYAKAGQLYRNALAHIADKEISVFYWDRLGLAHVREQQPELAQDIFQTLAKDHSQFWQLVAAARQLDLELNRLLNEPAS